MHLYSVIFYILALIILVATALAVTQRNLVHAVLYLVVSFFGTALLFYLFGAPLLAVLEVIIYAGAVMVLFLFIIMMLRVESTREIFFPLRQWVPAAVGGLVYLALGGLLVFTDADRGGWLETAVASPRDFGIYIFEKHWLAVEIASLLLLVALVGALHLGKTSRETAAEGNGDQR
jgi:NADH-quinone oxidoreductase subunit J